MKEDEKITRELQQMPEANIIIAKNKKNFNWYSSESGQKRYMHKNERKFAEKLAQKKLLQSRQKDIRRELKGLDDYLKTMQREDIEWNQMLEYFKGTGLVRSKCRKLEENWQKWMEEDYPMNPYFPERRTLHVTGDLYVRSKSEQTIALKLLEYGIPFRYECELVLKGSTYYPDFTIIHPKTGKRIYWEHFGTMDDPAYVKKTYEKLKYYKENGIILGDNLIISTEIKDKWCDASYAESIILHFLQ